MTTTRRKKTDRIAALNHIALSASFGVLEGRRVLPSEARAFLAKYETAPTPVRLGMKLRPLAEVLETHQ